MGTRGRMSRCARWGELPGVGVMIVAAADRSRLVAFNEEVVARPSPRTSAGDLSSPDWQRDDGTGRAAACGHATAAELVVARTDGLATD